MTTKSEKERLLHDCEWTISRNRAKWLCRTTGPHWSDLKRFVHLYDMALELRAELAALKAAQAWHPASEPPKDSPRWVYGQDDIGYCDLALWDDNRWYWAGSKNGEPAGDLSKWCELPAPPESEE